MVLFVRQETREEGEEVREESLGHAYGPREVCAETCS